MRLKWFKDQVTETRTFILEIDKSDWFCMEFPDAADLTLIDEIGTIDTKISYQLLALHRLAELVERGVEDARAKQD